MQPASQPPWTAPIVLSLKATADKWCQGNNSIQFLAYACREKCWWKARLLNVLLILDWDKNYLPTKRLDTLRPNSQRKQIRYVWAVPFQIAGRRSLICFLCEQGISGSWSSCCLFTASLRDPSGLQMHPKHTKKWSHPLPARSHRIMPNSSK